MFERFFSLILTLEDFYWSYIGFSLILLSGIYFTFQCKGFQVRVLLNPRETLRNLRDSCRNQSDGTHPFKLYFASVGGMIGLGNMVAVVTALLVGGPGALFWMWVAVFFGMIIQYIEIYLGVQYRVKNTTNGYDGGPMYYLKEAFPKSVLGKVLPFLFCVFLCIYGVEIFQFVVIVDTLDAVLPVNRLVIILLLLFTTLYTGFGGVNRLANVCTVLMPIFMVGYTAMCVWVMISYADQLIPVLKMVLKEAFTGKSVAFGTSGGTFLVAAQQGFSRAVYSGNIGVGYDSIIQSETRSPCPESQARLAIFGVVGDAIFSTVTMLTVMMTGVLWSGKTQGLKVSEYIATALGTTFPYIPYFMAFFFFLAGWTTIIGYVVVGTKCARFLSPRYGTKGYLLLAALLFLIFSFTDQTKVYSFMSLCGGILVFINLCGILKLRSGL